MLLILQELSHAEVLSRKLRSSEDSGVHADLNTVESETPTLGIWEYKINLSFTFLLAGVESVK